MYILERENEFNSDFKDQVVINNIFVDGVSSTIDITFTYTAKDQRGLIYSTSYSISVMDESTDNIDPDYLDRQYVIVDPDWEDMPAGFDLADDSTWGGLLWPEIPKIVDPKYVEMKKYFTRLYALLSCAQSDNQKHQITFDFFLVKESSFLESIFGVDYNKFSIITLSDENKTVDLDGYKGGKNILVKSLTQNAIYKKYGLIDQVNLVSDSAYAFRHLIYMTGLTQKEIIDNVFSVVGTNNTSEELRTVESKVNSMDFTALSFMKKLPDDVYADRSEIGEYYRTLCLNEVADRLKNNARKWCQETIEKINVTTSVDSINEIIKDITVDI